MRRCLVLLLLIFLYFLISQSLLLLFALIESLQYVRSCFWPISRGKKALAEPPVLGGRAASQFMLPPAAAAAGELSEKLSVLSFKWAECGSGMVEVEADEYPCSKVFRSFTSISSKCCVKLSIDDSYLAFTLHFANRFRLHLLSADEKAGLYDNCGEQRSIR